MGHPLIYQGKGTERATERKKKERKKEKTERNEHLKIEKRKRIEKDREIYIYIYRERERGVCVCACARMCSTCRHDVNLYATELDLLGGCCLGFGRNMESWGKVPRTSPPHLFGALLKGPPFHGSRS